MSDLYRGHDAKFWHGEYVKTMISLVDLVLANMNANPELKKDVLAFLDYEKPGWRDRLEDTVGRRPRPQGVEYGGNTDVFL